MLQETETAATNSRDEGHKEHRQDSRVWKGTAANLDMLRVARWRELARTAL
jgi:hypothetical protein